jgi:hypothetical protein
MRLGILTFKLVIGFIILTTTNSASAFNTLKGNVIDPQAYRMKQDDEMNDLIMLTSITTQVA